MTIFSGFGVQGRVCTPLFPCCLIFPSTVYSRYIHGFVADGIEALI